MTDGKPQKAIQQRTTREYPTEWAWYPADEEQDNTCLQTENDRERPPETLTTKVSYQSWVRASVLSRLILDNFDGGRRLSCGGS